MKEIDRLKKIMFRKCKLAPYVKPNSVFCFPDIDNSSPLTSKSSKVGEWFIFKFGTTGLV